MKMMNQLFTVTFVFWFAVGIMVFPISVLAQTTALGTQGQPRTGAQSSVAAAPLPTATVTLDPALSSCSSGSLNISVTTPIPMTREYGIVTTGTGAVLFEFEDASVNDTSYTGGYGFGSFSAPAGTIITLYGYMGQTPPKAANTAEFSVSYRCDTDGVVQRCAGPYGPCAKAPDFPALDGRWFKLNAVATGNLVDTGNGVLKPRNFSVPFYLGFVYDTTNLIYNVRIFTQTAPGVWANTSNTSRSTLIFTQNVFPDFWLQLNVNSATDHINIYHTPYIKYMLDRAGIVKAATYSGTGEVYYGTFNGGTSEYFGSVRITGSMVDVSKLPFTP